MDLIWVPAPPKDYFTQDAGYVVNWSGDREAPRGFLSPVLAGGKVPELMGSVPWLRKYLRALLTMPAIAGHTACLHWYETDLGAIRIFPVLEPNGTHTAGPPPPGMEALPELPDYQAPDRATVYDMIGE